MDTVEERLAAFEAELREKYNQKDRDAMAKKGHAMPDGSYPIGDKEDVEKAIKAVGMGDSSHAAIRKHVMANAKRLGCSDLIPDTWQADGSLKQQNSAEIGETRAECPTCKGTGKILEGNRTCPDCNGSGVEGRAKPTPEDYGIASALADAKTTLAAVKAKQLADPDNATDPDDHAVMGFITKAENAIDNAIVAQSKDGHSDPEPRGRRRKPRHRSVPLLPEVRHWRADGLEVRSSTTTDEIIITGSPIVYNTPYSVCDLFGEFEERMLPGVATGVLQNGADVRFLFNHDGLPLARSISGTLTLSDTPTKLNMRAGLDARQQLANDLAIAIERGDVTQMSCGFIVGRDTWDAGEEHRDVEELDDLLDVSAVTYPASPTTNLQIAQRMALEIPVESRARVRRLYTELRAGKVLSGDHKDKLVAAATAIHAVLDAAGFDPQQLIDGNDEENDQGTEPGRSTTEDGTIGGDSGLGDGSPGYADGTGTRALVDPGEQVKTASALRLQLEARRRRREAA